MARRMLKHSMLAALLPSMFVSPAWAQETPTAAIPENRPAQTASQVIYRGYNAAVVDLRQELANQVVEAIEEAMNTPNPYPDEEFREAPYRNLPHFAGAGLGA